MNDRTITRASRQGAHTTPVPNPSRRIHYERAPYFTPEEDARFVTEAREERLNRDLAAYAIRKRES